jgi:hypothetical protein
MRTPLSFGFAVLLLAACQPAAKTPATPPQAEAGATLAVPRLEPLWTLKGFSEPEGVALAPDGNYFISNVEGDSATADGLGFISKVSPTGELLNLRWANAGNAPKGMVVYQGALYVNDINRVLKLDANTGAQLSEIRIEGAQFLNDATVWNGAVHVSDSGTGTLHRIVGDTAEFAGTSPAWAGINGILGLDDGRLLVATMIAGNFLAVGKDNSENMIASGIQDADGIGVVPGGGYLVSGWTGQINYVGEDGQVTTLINTKGASIPQSTLQNDLTVFGDVVIVPNMVPGTVTAWKIRRD